MIPQFIEQYDPLGRYVIRINIKEDVIPADEMTNERVIYTYDELISESGKREDFVKALSDFGISEEEINGLLVNIDFNSFVERIYKGVVEPTEIIEPIRYAQFETIEAYNTVNVAIIAYKDELSGGEYTRTNTLYAYTPEPEAEWDGYYYMPAEPDLVEAGLFDGVTLLDSIPVEPVEEVEEA